MIAPASLLTFALALVAQGSTPEPAPGSGPPAGTAVLVLDPSAPPALEAARADVRDLIATALTERIVDEVATAETIRARLALDADKRELGCDDVSCAAEVANALGARWVVVTRLSVLGDQHILNVELLDATTFARPRARADGVRGRGRLRR